MNETVNKLRREAFAKAERVYNELYESGELGDLTWEAIYVSILAELVALDCVKTYLRINPNTQKFVEFGTKFSNELAAVYKTKYE